MKLTYPVDFPAQAKEILEEALSLCIKKGQSFLVLPIGVLIKE